VLFTTETFAMGLNMPARTVVFTNLKKFDGMEERCVCVDVVTSVWWQQWVMDCDNPKRVDRGGTAAVISG
jgi:hypothetical protein